jgi:small subunit ribosomal protein S20
MPIIKSAKKKMRADVKKHTFNLRSSRKMKQALNVKDAKNETDAFKAIDKAAKRGTIHRNKANRLKSRVSKRLSATTK